MTRTSVRSVLCLLLICSAAAVVPASAQHFKRMNGSLTQIAAGRNEVWGLNGSTIYRFNSSTQKFAEVKGTLTQIAVGGGTLLQKDEVWGIANGYFVYHFNFKTNSFDEVGCGFLSCLQLSQIAVGPGYEDNCHPYEVWGIADNQYIGYATYRYNYCTSGFDNIPNPTDDNFSQIATGGGDVWTIDPYGYVWEYESVLGGFWFGQGPAYSTIPGFEQISVGVNNVWTVNSGFWNWAPSTQYDQYSVTLGVSANQTATGGDGAWVIYDASGANGLIARYDFQLGPNSGGYGSGGFSSPFSLTSPAVQIAVGSGAGVWAIDTENRVYMFVRQ